MNILEQKAESGPSAAQSSVQNLDLISTHLQVSNLVKILFTLNPQILDHLVGSSPEELKVTQHYKILEATLAYYLTILEINESSQPESELEIVPQPVFEILKDSEIKCEDCGGTGYVEMGGDESHTKWNSECPTCRGKGKL